MRLTVCCLIASLGIGAAAPPARGQGCYGGSAGAYGAAGFARGGAYGYGGSGYFMERPYGGAYQITPRTVTIYRELPPPVVYESRELPPSVYTAEFDEPLYYAPAARQGYAPEYPGAGRLQFEAGPAQAYARPGGYYPAAPWAHRAPPRPAAARPPLLGLRAGVQLNVGRGRARGYCPD